jgi:hypothetical protein
VSITVHVGERIGERKKTSLEVARADITDVPPTCSSPLLASLFLPLRLPRVLTVDGASLSAAAADCGWQPRPQAVGTSSGSQHGRRRGARPFGSTETSTVRPPQGRRTATPLCRALAAPPASRHGGGSTVWPPARPDTWTADARAGSAAGGGKTLGRRRGLGRAEVEEGACG